MVSQYVLVSEHAKDPLTCSELWEYLQDALLSFPAPSSETDEHMSVFIRESIARGLVHILHKCCQLTRKSRHTSFVSVTLLTDIGRVACAVVPMDTYPVQLAKALSRQTVQWNRSN